MRPDAGRCADGVARRLVAWRKGTSGETLSTKCTRSTRSVGRCRWRCAPLVKKQEQRFQTLRAGGETLPGGETGALKKVIRGVPGRRGWSARTTFALGPTIVMPSNYGGPIRSAGSESNFLAPDVADAVNAEEAARGVRRRCVRLDLAA